MQAKPNRSQSQPGRSPPLSAIMKMKHIKYKTVRSSLRSRTLQGKKYTVKTRGHELDLNFTSSVLEYRRTANHCSIVLLGAVAVGSAVGS